MILKNGKIRESEKAKRRHGIAFYVIGTFTFAIESMLGLNAAFLIYQNVSIVADNMLHGTFLAPLSLIIALIISLAIGFCFIFGGMWVFGGFMDSLEDVKAYQKAYKTKKWPEYMVWALMSSVVALDLTTLLFRATYFAEKGAMALFAFFVILILLPPLLGSLMYVLEHTPQARRLAKSREFAEALESDDIEHLVQTIDPDLRSRWLHGDTSVIEEHQRRLEARQAEQLQIEQAEEADRAQGQAAKNRPLATASLADQAEIGSPIQ